MQTLKGIVTINQVSTDVFTAEGLIRKHVSKDELIKEYATGRRDFSREEFESQMYLNGANLEGINLNDAKLNGACMIGANLKNASFRNANLKWMDFSNAKLQGADLHSAQLQNANLYGAFGRYIIRYSKNGMLLMLTSPSNSDDCNTAFSLVPFASYVLNTPLLFGVVSTQIVLFDRLLPCTR